MKTRWFTGVMPALVTPLNADETLNAEVLHRLIGDLLTQGADGFYIGGATGEGISLSRETREELTVEALRAIGGKKPAIVHVASSKFSEAVALAQHAERMGADAISAIPPLFFRYDESDVFEYYKALAESVSIPLMVYYNPAAGFAMDARFAARLFEIDNVTAIKWTSSNYYQMVRLKEITHGEMNVMNGPDEMLLMGLSAGADGGIGTTYNFIFPIIKSIERSFREGNIAAAQAAQSKADRIIEALLRYVTIPATKVALEAMGYAVGNATFPMKRYTDSEKAQIVDGLRAAGLEI